MKKFVVALCLVAAGGATLSRPIAAQAPSFEVASVKPSNPNAAGPFGGVPVILPAFGRFTASNATLRMLVMTAYQKQSFQLVGGPSWLNSEKFDINAKAEEGIVALDATLERLKTLLADRFKLKVHTEMRELPIYALVPSRSDRKLGGKLKPSTESCPGLKEQQEKQLEAFAKGGLAAIAALAPKPGETRPCSFAPLPQTTPGTFGLKATGQPMATLAALLTQLTGRPVLDRTGLDGPYDFELTIDLQTIMRITSQLGVNLPLPQGLPEGPSLMTTLQEDLGLKLDSQRAPSEVLVIDSAELPTPD